MSNLSQERVFFLREREREALRVIEVFTAMLLFQTKLAKFHCYTLFKVSFCSK